MKKLIVTILFLSSVNSTHAENACDLMAKVASTILIEHADLVTKLFTTDRACTKEDNITDLLTHEGSFSDPNYGKRLEQAIKNFESGKGKSGWIGMVLKELKSVSESEYHSLLEQFKTFGNKVKEMNPQELKLFKREPFVAIWMDHNREKAEGFCYGDEFKKQFKDIQQSETYLGRIDACRHTLWNAMASRFGMSSFSEKFATAHETGASDVTPGAKNNPAGIGMGKGFNPKDPLEKLKFKEIEIQQEVNVCPKVHSKKFIALDHEMDIRNNETGRKLGMDSCKHSYNSKIIEENVVTAIKEGKTVVLNCRPVGDLVISKLEPSNLYMVKPMETFKARVPDGVGNFNPPGSPSRAPAGVGGMNPDVKKKKEVY